MSAPPPSYELPIDALLNVPLVDDSLPDYTPRATRVTQLAGDREFEYKIEKKGETFASLNVVSSAAYSKNIPTFTGAGPVKGSVNLYLKEPETITSIVLSIRGRFLPGKSDEEYRLFDISKTIWSKETDAAAQSPLLQKKKLSGDHSWPFSMPIPEKVQFTKGKKSSAPGTTEHNTPQTFNEKVLLANIRHEVVLRIGRGKLKTDNKVICIFGYIPVIQPPPFPPLKAVAYQEGSPLLGPMVDVDGWARAEAVRVSGTLFNSHPVTIECQLFLSAPLAYTRGSVIPLYLHMQSSDRTALDLLATSKAVVVRLQRKVRYSIPMANLKNPENLHTSMGKDIRDLVEAVWWPASSEEQPTESKSESSMHTICLNGELHLRADLVPSSTFPICTIEYLVSLRPFNAPGFKIASTAKTLLDHPVDIVTAYAPGPRAVRSAPPGYDAERLLTVDREIPHQVHSSFM